MGRINCDLVLFTDTMVQEIGRGNCEPGAIEEWYVDCEHHTCKLQVRRADAASTQGGQRCGIGDQSWQAETDCQEGEKRPVPHINQSAQCTSHVRPAHA